MLECTALFKGNAESNFTRTHMQKLTNKQLKYLRNIAHSLKPVVIIGQQGLSDNVLEEIKKSLDYHELLKVKVNAPDKESRAAMINSICEKLVCSLVQQIGHIGIFFKENPEQQKIKFP